jgi:hypothetical protein
MGMATATRPPQSCEALVDFGRGTSPENVNAQQSVLSVVYRRSLSNSSMKFDSDVGLIRETALTVLCALFVGMPAVITEFEKSTKFLGRVLTTAAGRIS